MSSADIPHPQVDSLQPVCSPKLSRHRLLAAAHCDLGAGKILDIHGLRRHLQTAIELEHATIPVYLCALYTMNEARNPFAYKNMQGIVMEEMLHMVQAANLLNAIGGAPAINTPDFVPAYPTHLPHSDGAVEVSLQKFSPQALEEFLKIERPAAQCAPPQADHYHTIGQFYHAIKEAMERLDAQTPGGIFCGRPERQIGGTDYYGAGGVLLQVHCLAHATEAIDEITGQGEGMNGEIEDPDRVLFGEDIEYAHYFRFNEILQGCRYRPGDSAQLPPTGAPVVVHYASTLNMRPNPKMAHYPTGSPTWQRMREFNLLYGRMLDKLHQACNGMPTMLAQAVPLMYQLKYQAIALMHTPSDDGNMAGPSFEYIAPR